MEILASQPGLKYYDEPFNIRRTNVQDVGLFREWREMMPEAERSEDIIRFLQDLQKNRHRVMNPPPLRRNYRPITNRIVFKLHGLEHLINEIKDQNNGLVVFLLRHPIPTTQSRYMFPRLDHFMSSCFYRERYLSEAQYKEIQSLHCKGSKLQRGIVSWCFENLIPLRFSPTQDWLFITYEELLLNPENTCRILADRLSLPRVDRMLEAINTPAANIAMSRKETLEVLNSADEQRRRITMVKKWRSKITSEEEARCFEILDLFEIDAYRPKHYVAHERYLHDPSTAQRLEEG